MKNINYDSVDKPIDNKASDLRNIDNSSKDFDKINEENRIKLDELRALKPNTVKAVTVDSKADAESKKNIWDEIFIRHPMMADKIISLYVTSSELFNALKAVIESIK